jgi:hypothetical protein
MLLIFGMIKRIRGTVTTCRLAPSSAARVAYSAKGLLQSIAAGIYQRIQHRTPIQQNSAVELLVLG